MKKIFLKSISFFVSFINPGQLNSAYKTLSRFAPFKKTIYETVKFVIQEKIKLENYDLFLNQKDPMVSGAITLNVYENFEKEIFIQAIKPDMTVIDIGANIGYYTLLAASRVKLVLGFEPDAMNYRLLTKNVVENNCKNVSCYELAIADKEGPIFLFENPDNFGDRRIYSFDDSNSKAQVSAVTLDNFLDRINLNRVDFIKMDIQGAEGRALTGMKKTLEHPDLQLLMEFFPSGLRQSGFDPMDVLKMLTDKKFKIYHINGGRRKLELITDFEPYVNRFKNSDYANLYCKK
ncbi:MAG TPA: FkbM family methyltransferase [Patescibacteria group bacterium]